MQLLVDISPVSYLSRREMDILGVTFSGSSLAQSEGFSHEVFFSYLRDLL